MTVQPVEGILLHLQREAVLLVVEFILVLIRCSRFGIDLLNFGAGFFHTLQSIQAVPGALLDQKRFGSERTDHIG